MKASDHPRRVPRTAALIVICAAMAASGGCASQAPQTTVAKAPPTAATAAQAPETAVAQAPRTATTRTPVKRSASRPAARSASAHTTQSTGPRRPAIVWDPIPFGPGRKAEMAAYAGRHYGSFMKPTWRLIHPHVIVIHYTVTPTFSSTYNTFAADVADSELHELPGTCAHFVIDRYGRIHQLVSLGIMCRHTVGLNWTAIGIEHVGFSDAQVLSDRRQLLASLHLVRWLRCRFHIAIKNVIGHNESLSSPYHHEDVPALRTQTHSDFNLRDMRIYRARLRRQGGCG